MSELNASNLRKEHGNEGPDLVGVTELTSPYFMVPPSGTTAERPQNPQKGTLRFNTDIGSLEYFKGGIQGWESIDRVNPNLGGGGGSNLGTGTRGLFGIGYVSPSGSDKIQSIKSTILSISLMPIPLVVIAAVPILIPLVINGLFVSYGTIFLFTVIPAFSKQISAFLPDIFLLVKSIKITWVSVPPVINL